MAKTSKIQSQCQECGKKWKVSPDSSPECPKCGSVDWDVMEDDNSYEIEDHGDKVWPN